MTEAPKWISFQLEERASGKKTDVWNVWSTGGSHYLGRVAWFGAWRKYAFFPAPATLYDPECLRDVAAFLEVQTAAHQKGKRAAP
jgi:hypothetical protein